MGQEAVTIIDMRKGGKGELINAILHTDLDVKQLIVNEKVWGPARSDALLRLLEHGVAQIPDHVFWNWGRKAMPTILSMMQQKTPLLAYSYLGIGAEGTMQGQMMVCLSDRDVLDRDLTARLEPDKGKPLVYVEYLETAPWNAREFTDSPDFKGIGTCLLQAAIRLSIDEGFSGRVGLHSLEQARSLYAGPCGMQSLGRDGDYEYFELSAAQAAKLRGT
jgi:hypothetical protein